MVFLRASAAVLAAAVILALAQIQGLLDLQKVLEPYVPTNLPGLRNPDVTV